MWSMTSDETMACMVGRPSDMGVLRVGICHSPSAHVPRDRLQRAVHRRNTYLVLGDGHGLLRDRLPSHVEGSYRWLGYPHGPCTNRTSYGPRTPRYSRPENGTASTSLTRSARSHTSARIRTRLGR